MKKLIIYLKQILLKRKNNSLTIVGVGPGDSSLLTSAAIKAIKKANIIFYPISGDKQTSYAAEVVEKYVKFKKKFPIIFPMARKQFNAEEIWGKASKLIISSIQEGNSAVLLCLGDPSIYGSASYISNVIRKNHPEVLVKILPGISSVSAAAAIYNWDLLRKGEILKILECPDDPNIFENFYAKEFNNNTVIVLMKVGKRWPWLKEKMIQKGIIDKSFVAVNVGMKDQLIEKANKISSEKLPYFSLLFFRN